MRDMPITEYERTVARKCFSEFAELVNLYINVKDNISKDLFQSEDNNIGTGHNNENERDDRTGLDDIILEKINHVNHTLTNALFDLPADVVAGLRDISVNIMLDEVECHFTTESILENYTMILDQAGCFLADLLDALGRYISYDIEVNDIMATMI